jgi:cytochrome P450
MVLAFVDGCTYCTAVQIPEEALMQVQGQGQEGAGEVVWPPGPRWPRVVQTVWWAARPLSLLDHCRRRYGEVFRVRPYGHGDIVCVADPELIKQVFAGDRDVFRAGAANAAMGPVLGAHSLLLLDGERHLAERRLMLPPFHGEAIRRYEERVRQIAEAEIATWPVGRPFPLRPRMQAITLEAILRAVMGVSDPARLDRLRTLLPELLDFSVLDMWSVWIAPWVLDSPLARRHKSMRIRPEVDRLLFEEIAAHRRDPAGRDDILALLVAARDEDGRALSDEELRDQLVTLLLAGHETTATGLAWAFERLLRHPRVLERLRAGLAAGEDDYLDAVVKETLRVRPVIDSVWRKLAGPAEVAGCRLPAGTLVMPVISLVQRSGAFAEPDEFRPERFLEGSPPPYTFIPFGGGPRRCIGASFALMEMRTVIGAVLEAVELEAGGSRPEGTRVHHVTLVPSAGGRVVVTARRPAPVAA